MTKPRKEPSIDLYDAYLSAHYAIDEFDMILGDMLDIIADIKAKKRSANASIKRISAKYKELTGKELRKV
jgi:hypothetical protein